MIDLKEELEILYLTEEEKMTRNQAEKEIKRLNQLPGQLKMNLEEKK